jgi:predicted nucleotidyltransferase
MTEQKRIEINQIITSQIQKVFTKLLDEVILYGSYARGDFDNESDIDIAAIVSLERKEIEKYGSAVVKLISALSLDYDVWVSINCIPKDEFAKWKTTLPYYQNIDQEGIRLYA